ncbi:MAG: hypothetical protein LBJ90_02965 [Treponema sp.]|jgi:hypothetical protein|nr:hypothetical protein [Treponema sp.]
MASFDVSKKWIVLSPASVPAAGQAAAELADCISLLRSRAGLGKASPVIEDAETFSPPDSEPVILLNSGGASLDRNGYTWRLGKGRLEIYGDSDRGLCGGVFDFLSALGINWPKPGCELFPPPSPGAAAGSYPLAEDRAYCPSASSPSGLRRLIINEKTKPRDPESLVRWAARNRCDALVLSFRGKLLWDGTLLRPVKKYAMMIEAGGWDLSLLLPRGLFFFHRELFRMEGGGRTSRYNFCPTNPETMEILRKNGARLFGRAGPLMSGEAGGGSGPPPAHVFHLWPDHGREKLWCSCPACRAFTPEEQSRIALNAAADALAGIDPGARLSFCETPEDGGKGAGGAADGDGDSTPPAGGIRLRKNIFVLDTYPECVPKSTTSP